MVAVPSTPSRVFAMPGWSGPISAHHGDPNAIGGADLMVTSAGTQAVVSMVSGTVQFISSEATAPNSGGNAVQIRGIDGLDYYYAHLSNSIILKVGDKVSAGQMLGYAGNSGNAKTTAPHLHIGIGKSIQSGLGAYGGLGTGFNAIQLLKGLVGQKQANNPDITSPDNQANLTGGQQPGTIDVNTLHFASGVPGFDLAHSSDILMNLKKALEMGVDPFIWLGIVSHESGFNKDAVNPTSGACGYAQIYPCIHLPPMDNVKEGIKRLKGFLDQCNGDYNCALNKYSGGGGQSYIDTVRGNASKIKDANPDLSTASTAAGSVGIDTIDSSGSSTTPDSCPPILVPIAAGLQIPFPDVGCIITKSVNDLQDQVARWFTDWQTEHVTNVIFVGAGLALILVGILLVASTQVNIEQVTKTAMKATPEGAVASAVTG